MFHQALLVFTFISSLYSTFGFDPIQDSFGPALAVSGDGSAIYVAHKMFVCKRTIQSDYLKWVPTNSEESYNWVSITTDYTGNIIAGTFSNTEVHLSVDRGATYQKLQFDNDLDTFVKIKVSSDGTMLYFVGTKGVRTYNITSQTAAQSVLDTPITFLNWLSAVDCSKDGKHVVIGAHHRVWVSSDYGANFKLAK